MTERATESLYLQGCGVNCPCQRWRRFGEGYVVFSSGEVDEIEELAVPSGVMTALGPDLRRARRRTLARVRVFIRPRYLEVS